MKPRKFAHSERFALPRMTAPGLPQAPDELGVGRHAAAGEGEGAGGRLHGVVGGDVVLEQHGDAVERPADAAVLPLGVALRRDADGLWVRLDDGAKQRIQLVDTVQVGLRQLAAGQAS